LPKVVLLALASLVQVDLPPIAARVPLSSEPQPSLTGPLLQEPEAEQLWPEALILFEPLLFETEDVQLAAFAKWFSVFGIENIFVIKNTAHIESANFCILSYRGYRCNYKNIV
jgi:hypothetical protein